MSWSGTFHEKVGSVASYHDLTLTFASGAPTSGLTSVLLDGVEQLSGTVTVSPVAADFVGFRLYGSSDLVAGIMVDNSDKYMGLLMANDYGGNSYFNLGILQIEASGRASSYAATDIYPTAWSGYSTYVDSHFYSSFVSESSISFDGSGSVAAENWVALTDFGFSAPVTSVSEASSGAYGVYTAAFQMVGGSSISVRMLLSPDKNAIAGAGCSDVTDFTTCRFHLWLRQ